MDGMVEKIDVTWNRFFVSTCVYWILNIAPSVGEKHFFVVCCIAAVEGVDWLKNARINGLIMAV